MIVFSVLCLGCTCFEKYCVLKSGRKCFVRVMEYELFQWKNQRKGSEFLCFVKCDVHFHGYGNLFKIILCQSSRVSVQDTILFVF